MANDAFVQLSFPGAQGGYVLTLLLQAHPSQGPPYSCQEMKGTGCLSLTELSRLSQSLKSTSSRRGSFLQDTHGVPMTHRHNRPLCQDDRGAIQED
jgi:hypothetical protein